MGVDLFMLISGWLLGGQLLRESSGGPLHVKRFCFKALDAHVAPYYALLLIFYVRGAGLGGIPGSWARSAWPPRSLYSLPSHT